MNKVSKSFVTSLSQREEFGMQITQSEYTCSKLKTGSFLKMLMWTDRQTDDQIMLM